MKSLRECKNALEFLDVNFEFRKPKQILGIEEEVKKESGTKIRKRNKVSKKSRRKNRR